MVKYFAHTYQGSHGTLIDWYASANGVAASLGECGGQWWRLDSGPIPPAAVPATKQQLAAYLDELGQEDPYIAGLKATILAHVPSAQDEALHAWVGN